MTTPVQGGSFLYTPVGEADPFIPEELSPELLQLRDTTRDFIEGEVMPHDAAIEEQSPGVIPTCLKKAGELGLMMVEVPEAYGGLGIGKVAATVVAESCVGQGSFIVSLLCQTGIAMLPLVYYGNEQQKQKYLPKLASGEMIGAYALTEAGAGSDALAARTKATLSEDGKHYLLNGEKIYVTNGGFADLYTVFAKVDGEQFSAFLVERGMQGVSQGPEEKKLGIKGSSTITLILQDAKIPKENLLGEIGKGHKIAFNTLNVGRWKLGAAAVGGCKATIAMACRYVKERRQFGRAIADFELTQQKIAAMAIKTFLTESIVYRYAGDLDRANAAVDMATLNAYEQRAKLTEELSIEASISKVFGSERLFELADEAVQLYGGYGFIQEYRPERYYRDNRINRIFEGTNEINRLLIPGTLMKRMAKGRTAFLDTLTEILGHLKEGFPGVDPSAPLAIWQDQVNHVKKLAVYVGGVAVNTFGPEIQEKQQILANMADLTIAAYVADSALARVLKLFKQSPDAAKIPTLMVQCYCAEEFPKLKVLAQQTLCDIAEADAAVFASYQKALGRFLPFIPFDLRAARKQIADVTLEHSEYRLTA